MNEDIEENLKTAEQIGDQDAKPTEKDPNNPPPQSDTLDIVAEKNGKPKSSTQLIAATPPVPGTEEVKEGELHT